VKLIKVMGQELKLRLSPTFIQNAACPAYLKFKYVDKVGSKWVRVEAERGKAAHEAIRELTEFCMAEKQEIAEIEDGMLREALQKYLPQRIVSEAGLVMDWLRLWRDRWKLPKNIHGVEEKIALNDEYDECEWDNASYRGIIDVNQITNDHCIITDYKSQPHIIPESELAQAFGSDIAEQFTFYAWLTWKMYPYLKTFTVRLWYLRYGFYQEASRTLEDLVLFEHALLLKEKKISEIDNWDPQPGKHCQYCEYIHLCPIAQDLSPNNPEVITQEQAVLAAQRLVVFDALSKDLKAKLKHYVNHNDNVVIGDNYVFGYHHKKSTIWDPAEAEEVLLEHNRRLSEVANVDARKMKKLIKTAAMEDPQLESALEDIAKEKHRTEFEGYRKGESEE